jgi:hypothetical protein
MNALSLVEPDPAFASAMAVRMADEGIPIRAIARATRLPSSEVYSALQDAIDRGVIVQMPKDDWPSNSNRGTRSPSFPSTLERDDIFLFACSKAYKLTRLEASVFAVLLRRDMATKEQLHLASEASRPGENRAPTEPKIVDVVICKLRKKLTPHNIPIETSWGNGYYIAAEHQATAVAALGGALETKEAA